MAETHEMPKKMGAMRSGNTFLVLRSIMAVLVGALAVAALANGRIGIGLVLAALAITNVVMTVTMYRRRAEFRFWSTPQAASPPASGRRSRTNA